jgi:hypothetical protein
MKSEYEKLDPVMWGICCGSKRESSVESTAAPKASKAKYGKKLTGIV